MTHDGRYWQDFTKRNQRTIDAVCDLMAEHGLNAQEGQQVLLYVAGLSAGLEQKPITGMWVEPAAAGWQVAAHLGD